MLQKMNKERLEGKTKGRKQENALPFMNNNQDKHQPGEKKSPKNTIIEILVAYKRKSYKHDNFYNINQSQIHK